MSDKSTDVTVGPGFLGLLTILFIGLKLTGHLAWSWWWVLAPMTAPVVIVAVGACVVAVVAVLSSGR